MILLYSRLFRLRLALLNGIAAAGGYLLYPAEPEAMRLFASLIGVALLAAGGSALNQLMECDLDSLMERTRCRPLPAGELTPATAAIVAGIVILAGLVQLAAVGGPIPAGLGGFALFLYLVVYTPLKRRTSCALAVGAVCGAIPPLIGWCIAGGQPLDFRVVLLAGLLYLWQIPHFWLFQRRHAEDYRRAGIPSVSAAMNSSIFSILFRLWIVALVAGAMLLPAFGIVGQTAGFWYAAFPLPLLLISLNSSEKALFSYLNLFPLLVTLVLLFQRGL